MRKGIFRVALISFSMLLLLTSCKTLTIIQEETEEAQASSVIDDVIPSVTETTEVTTEATTVPTTTEAPSETQTQSNETVILETEVDLSITLPEANGKMRVDMDPTNKFTSIIAEDKNISADLLVAVYTVPETDQNYVFEFYSKNFTADNLRRVYLLNSDCKITGVAADKSDERKDMSVTENWFCMNVLIKGVIFPEIEEQFK